MKIIFDKAVEISIIYMLSKRRATMAQQVARILGKDEVGGSSPLSSL